MLNIDSFAYENRLRHMHPMEKAAFAGLTMIICLAFSSLVISSLVVFIMAIALIGYARIPGRFYLKLLLLPLTFLSVGVLTILISITSDSQAAGWLGKVTVGGISIGVTHEGWVMAAKLFLRSLGAVSCLYFLSLTTPVVEITSVMRGLRIPSLFIELTELIYRFIFVLAETAGDIFTSQSCRWGYSSFRNSLKSLGQMVAALFVKSHSRSQKLYTALSARGYDGRLNVLEPKYNVSAKNICLFLAVDAALVGLAIFLEVGVIG